jgi:hypothetical protein
VGFASTTDMGVLLREQGIHPRKGGCNLTGSMNPLRLKIVWVYGTVFKWPGRCRLKVPGEHR